MFGNLCLATKALVQKEQFNNLFPENYLKGGYGFCLFAAFLLVLSFSDKSRNYYLLGGEILLNSRVAASIKKASFVQGLGILGINDQRNGFQLVEKLRVHTRAHAHSLFCLGFEASG